MKKNIILVTGGAGFIGSSLIKYLIKLIIKEKIISIDNYSSGYVKNHITNKKVKYIKGENKNIELILKKYKNKIKLIFHFGEFSRIYQSFKIIKNVLNIIFITLQRLLSLQKIIKLNLYIQLPQATLVTMVKMKICLHMLGQNQKILN